MKRSARIFTVILAAALLTGSFCLTGCGTEPWKTDTWYLTSYRDEAGTSHSVGIEPYRPDKALFRRHHPPV